MTPTPEGKQLAAETVTITCEAWEFLLGQGPLDGAWFNDTHPTKPGGYWWRSVIRASHVVNEPDTALKAKHEEALADLREIDRIAERSLWARPKFNDAGRNTVADIAAKYRVETDPLFEAMKAVEPMTPWEPQDADKLRAELSKRGYEIGGKSSQQKARVSVPDAQTPLNDKLGHRLLDVVKEGQAARDNGTGSPYHGHSLEHCLHAIGWVQRDLRIALDEIKGRGK